MSNSAARGSAPPPSQRAEPGDTPVTVLAADIGGTKTWMQLAVVQNGRCRVLGEHRYDSQAHAEFEPLARDFLQRYGQRGAAAAACFAMAGPVSGDQGSVTNLPWRLSARALEQTLGIPKVVLINDFQAVGHGIDALEPADLAVLQHGDPLPQAPRAVIGAGTGLGEGILVWCNSHYAPLPTEGGHVDFAPTDEQQIGLLRHLRARYDHVSYERIVSGPGLVNVYSFLRDTMPQRESADLREAMRGDDAAARISEAALVGGDALAQEALDLFVRIYGAQAGNLALTCLPFGGLYLAGGIAPKILPRLQSGEFMRSFLAKGRMAAVLVTVPVRVILNPKVGLLGSALAASRL